MKAVLWQEWRLARRTGAGLLPAVLFTLLVCAVTAFAVGSDLALLARIGPGTLWVAVLLASLLGLDGLFADDVGDGTFDLVRTSGTSTGAFVLAKILARWGLVVLPLCLASPLAALLLAMAPSAIGGALLTLLIGSPALAALGALSAALAATFRAGPLLGPVVVLPLLVPTIVFGASAAAAWGTEAGTTPLLLLVASTLATLALAPVGAAALLAGRG